MGARGRVGLDRRAPSATGDDSSREGQRIGAIMRPLALNITLPFQNNDRAAAVHQQMPSVSPGNEQTGAWDRAVCA